MVTPVSVDEDIARLVRAPAAVRDDVLRLLISEHRLTCTGLDCSVCSMLDCPAYSPMHYSYEGCFECHAPPVHEVDYVDDDDDEYQGGT